MIKCSKKDTSAHNPILPEADSSKNKTLFLSVKTLYNIVIIKNHLNMIFNFIFQGFFL